MREKLRVQDWKSALITIIFGAVGAAVFVLVNVVPMPFRMISLLKFGFVPALAIIAVVGGIRGPLSGLITGYLGVVSYDLLIHNVVVLLTLPALAYGALGLVVGLASYDFSRGKSLGKLSLLAAIGLGFTALLLVVFGLFVGQMSALAEVGFVMLPLLTTGLPSVILLTPILARLWFLLTQRVQLPRQFV